MLHRRSSSTVKVALYDADGTNGFPSTVLASASADTATTGLKKPALSSSVALTAGTLYWLGINRSSSSIDLRSTQGYAIPAFGSVALGATIQKDYGTCVRVDSDSHSSFPGSSLSGGAFITSTTPPHLFLQVV